MNSKQYAIEKLEEHLKLQERHLEEFEGNIKNLHNEIAITEANKVKMKPHITGLKDAILKLKGLDNLEKKNKIADSAEPDPSSLKEKFKIKEAELTKLKRRREDLEELAVENNSTIQDIIVHLEILAEAIAKEGAKK